MFVLSEVNFCKISGMFLIYSYNRVLPLILLFATVPELAWKSLPN